MKLKVFDTAGKELRELDAADEVFGIEPNRAVLHQAYVTQMGNRRGGNASTKGRGEVRGSSVKIRKQKGLGASRQGTIRASHRVGGGVAFGPKPHSFVKDFPRTMTRLALRSALRARRNRSTSSSKGSRPRLQDLRCRTLMRSASNARALVRRHVPELALAARNIMPQCAPSSELKSSTSSTPTFVMTNPVRACDPLWRRET